MAHKLVEALSATHGKHMIMSIINLEKLGA